MIDLQRFCANESDPRPYLRAPFKRGQWVYATNGHVCVRVPVESEPDAQESDRSPNAGALFEKHIENRECEFLLMPKIPDLIQCSGCAGEGRVRAIKCAPCSGTGVFQHFGDTYDCQRCADSAAGPGWDERLPFDDASPEDVMRVCDNCDGLGYALSSNGVMALGDSTYSPVYLSWIAALPQVRICPGGPAAAHHTEVVPAAFIFDGGQGIVMPRRSN